MKGIIFNVTEEIVSAEHGEDAWDALLEAAELDGAYTSLGNYSDVELGKLVEAAAAALSRTPAEILSWIGEKALPLFAARYPAFFEPHERTAPFLLTLNGIIHPEVRKLYPGADVPVFGFESPSDDELRMIYRSPRRLCAFAEGLVLGAAAHFSETVDIRRPSCMLRGDERCVFELRFRRTPVAEPPA